MKIKLHVRSAVDESLDEVYMCEFVNKGMKLVRDGEKTIKIPIGTEADVIGENQFQVNLRGEPLHLTVKTPFGDQTELIQDMIGFLKGENEAPEPSSFSGFRIPIDSTLDAVQWSLVGLVFFTVVAMRGWILWGMMTVAVGAGCIKITISDDMSDVTKIVALVAANVFWWGITIYVMVIFGTWPFGPN